MNDKKLTMPSHDDSAVIKFGLGVIFIVFVLLGGWSYLAPLSASSVAIGQVSADMDKKTIQHLEGGIVEQIFVKDGDKVKKGDLLIKLKDVHIKGQLIQIQNQIEGYTSLLESKQKRLESINEEILEWDELYKQQLVDKLRIRELQREFNSIEGDIANTKSEIAKLKEQIIVINDTLSRSKIVSPIDGTVVGLEIHTIGGVLAPGKPILEIVPQNTKLIVVAQVQTTDIDKVKVGLLSDIRFSAFNLNQAHVVEGKVIHVSADSFINETTGMPYYETKVEVTQKGKEQLKEYGFILVSGMPAEVMINIGERTPLSYFIKPFTDMLSRGFNEE
ncbi:MAG: HlyD family efflux transporter periplasmic adaptor subunit [Campylobacterota bacterium]|nr:HlyD family efflux transporter periplasmic adaptor subunit [Campylobacterota bacterium]